MRGYTTPNSKSNGRMLKKAASGVLASFRPSTYRKGTPRAFTRCGLADGLFEHPVRLCLVPVNVWPIQFRRIEVGLTPAVRQSNAWPLRMDLARQYTKCTSRGELPMVLIYESDPLDNEDARGRFYHVCRGRIDRKEIQLPAGEQVYDCLLYTSPRPRDS